MSQNIAHRNLISQATYAKTLRPFLPKKAFSPDPSKLIVLGVNLGILVLGWSIARHLNLRSIPHFALYLPLVVVMGNSVIVLLFSSHDLFHGSVLRRSRVAHILGLLGLTLLWMPPTLWQIVHNRIHHTTTNTLADPDRNYLHQQPNTWGKWIQNAFVPSSDVTPMGLLIGLPFAWGVHTFRHLTSVLLFNSSEVNYVPAAFTVKPKERRMIALELLIITLFHASIVAYLRFDPARLLGAYFLPIGLGYAGLIAYIYTNHLACPMTEINDPLVNSVSIRVPKWLDWLHLNFSYHAEHHIFPGLNSDYYPQVRELLQRHYPERMGYVMTAQQAWHRLRNTPRLYQDETTFTNWSGSLSVPCTANYPGEPSSIRGRNDAQEELARPAGNV
ncbi:fatty acid desaturase [Nodosilinea sp. LEGE 07088]|uniref:fatty acid desaturase family protein n=1 Tax=Nodosilinea sp. LEGE 07088 TaxID=2777968 RepID=UPI00187FF285|nr:fatty acid desaturase [Nodosilinea sp. LEGE 07088]MBE9138622.1 fatty acid desaturase [Nodosilinea sp. LEGE 07088]